MLQTHGRAILDLAARHGARHVRVFGSMARGEAGPESDVDLLVDVEPGRTLLDVIALEQEVQALLGRSVEVLTDGGLSPYGSGFWPTPRLYEGRPGLSPALSGCAPGHRGLLRP